MAGLFAELARERRGEPSRLGSRTWDQRLELQFGYAITGDLFTEEFRGRALPVIHRGRYGLMVWDLWPRQGPPRGGLVLVVPLPRQADLCGLTQILRQWRGRHRFPAFLDRFLHRTNGQLERRDLATRTCLLMWAPVLDRGEPWPETAMATSPANLAGDDRFDRERVLPTLEQWYRVLRGGLFLFLDARLQCDR